MIYVLAIHGVGFHPKGRIKKAVEDSLQKQDIKAEVVEFNWSDLAPSLSSGGRVSLHLLDEVAKTVTRSAFIEERGGVSRKDRKAVWALRLCEAGRFLLLASISFGVYAYVAGSLALIPLSLPHANFWFPSFRVTVLAAVVLLLTGSLANCYFRISSAQWWRFPAALRRAALLLLVPALVLCTTPFMLTWSSFQKPVRGYGLLLFAHMGIVLLGYSSIEYLLHQGDQPYLTATEAAKGIGISAVLIACVVTFVALLAVIAMKVVPTLLKVGLDVLRYTGSTSYREMIQKGLEREYRAITERLTVRDTLYILGHSLGSVIAVDFLLNQMKQRPACRVVLITGGSPIRRFFQRFYPNQFFPRTATATANVLAHSNTSFTWVNIYRPRDPVGTALGLKQHPCVTEVNTGQPKSWITAHEDYWSDPKVLDAAFSGLKDVASREAKLGHVSHEIKLVAEDVHCCPIRDYTSPWSASLPTSSIAIASAILGLALAIWLAGTSIVSYVSEARKQEQAQVAVAQRGIGATGEVVYFRNVINPGSGNTQFQFEDVYTISFQTDDGRREINQRIINDAESLNTSLGYINLAALRDRVLSVGLFVEPQSPLSRGLGWKARRVLGDVRVRFLPEDPDRIALPDYQVTRSVWETRWLAGKIITGSCFMGLTLGLFSFVMGLFALYGFMFLAGDAVTDSGQSSPA